LSLRVGNEKRPDQTDTVGCCSLRVEHMTLYEELDIEDFVVEFDFCGKHSVSYQYKVTVEKDVFENLQGFVEDKEDTEQVFDKVTVSCDFMTFLEHKQLIILTSVLH